MAKFEAGKSGNPGGRPKVVSIIESLGEDPKQLRKEMFQLAIKVVRAGPKSTNDASFRHQFDWLAAHLGIKPREQLEVISDVSPEAMAYVAALRLTPHERRQEIDAGDESAMRTLVDGDASASE